MGAYMTVSIGVALIAAGLWGMWATWPLFWIAVQAIVPAMCVLGGSLALLVGAGELWDRETSKKAPTDSGQPSSQSTGPAEGKGA